MGVLDAVNQTLARNLRNLENSATKAPLELCKIEKVNTDNYTVSAYFFSSKVNKDNVAFCFPYTNLDKGIMFMPEVGALGVAFWSYRNEPIIVSFLAPTIMLEDGTVTRVNPSMGNFMLEPLNEGEFLLVSSGRSFIKGDIYGSLLMSTPLFNYIKLDEALHTIFLNSENSNFIDESRNIFTGIAKENSVPMVVGTPSDVIYLTENIERVYETSDNTITLDVDEVEALPAVLEIQKGNVFDIINGVKTLLENVDASIKYRMQVVTDEVASAQTSAAAHIVLADSSSAEDDYYNDWSVEILNDLPAGIKGHVRIIEDYDGASKQAFVTEDWSIIPTTDSIYRVSRSRSIIEVDRLGKLFLGNRETDYRPVARVGDSVSVTIGNDIHIGVITSGSNTVLASG